MSACITATFSKCLTHTFVLLDGEHWQSVDDLIGGQRSAQGTAKDILERNKTMQNLI